MKRISRMFIGIVVCSVILMGSVGIADATVTTKKVKRGGIEKVISEEIAGATGESGEDNCRSYAIKDLARKVIIVGIESTKDNSKVEIKIPVSKLVHEQEDDFTVTKKNDGVVIETTIFTPQGNEISSSNVEDGEYGIELKKKVTGPDGKTTEVKANCTIYI